MPSKYHIAVTLICSLITGIGALNPNTIYLQGVNISIATSHQKTSPLTWLPDTERGSRYAFGNLLNGIKTDPEATAPWPHSRPAEFTPTGWKGNPDAAAIRFQVASSRQEDQYVRRLRIIMWMLTLGLNSFIFWNFLFPEHQFRKSFRYKF